MDISLSDTVQYLVAFPEYVKVREALKHKRDWMVLSGEFSKLAKLERLAYALTPWNYESIEEEANKIKITPRIAYFPEDTLILLDEKKDAAYIELLQAACEEKNPIAVDVYARYLLCEEIRCANGDYALYLARGHGGHHSGLGIFRCGLSDKLAAFLTRYKSYLSPQFFLLHVINHVLNRFKLTFSGKYKNTPFPHSEKNSTSLQSDHLFPHSYLLHEINQALGRYENIINSVDKNVIQLIPQIFNSDNLKVARTEAFVELVAHVKESSLAKFCVGCCYGLGGTVEKDESKANAWIQAAAADKLYLACVVLNSLSTGK